MAYKALVLNLLISAPGDIPPESLTTIRKAISQWNCNYGQQFSLNVLPISWTEHAVAEFGDRPQALLNKQIVDDADLAIALFRDRLGTPTGEAESGTAEEIKVLAEADKQIAILVDNSPRNPLTGPALKERQRLEDYLSKLYNQALILRYADDKDLIGHINNFLSRSASQFQQNAEQAKKETPHENDFDPYEGVWPSVEVHERPVYKSNSQGPIKTKPRWELVLNNTSRGPAKNVNFVFEGLSSNAFFKVRKKGPIGTIPPRREVRFPLVLGWGSPSTVECIVTWTDAKGNQRTSQSTIHT